MKNGRHELGLNDRACSVSRKQESTEEEVEKGEWRGLNTEQEENEWEKPEKDWYLNSLRHYVHERKTPCDGRPREILF